MPTPIPSPLTLRRSKGALRVALHLGLGAVAVGVASMSVAHFTHPMSAKTQLFSYERTFATETEAADFVAFVTSPSSLQMVAKKQGESAQALADRCRASVTPGEPKISVSVVAPSAAKARALAQTFSKHVAICADESVARRSSEADRQLEMLQARLVELRNQFADFDEALLHSDLRTLREGLAKEAGDRAAALTALQAQMAIVAAEQKKVMASLSAERPAVRTLQQELDQALTRFTDEHPKVKELRASIAALQKEVASQTNAQLAELNTRYAALSEQVEKAEVSEAKARVACQKFATNEVAFARLQTEYGALAARRDELVQSSVTAGAKNAEHWRVSDKIETARIADPARTRKFGFAGSLLGLCAGAGSLTLASRRRRVIRTPEALADATALPVLGILQDLKTMDAAARDYWALETLERLRKTAGVTRRGCFVCGFISANTGEGCSTWIDLLASAGLRHGHRVLVISRPQGLALAPALENGGSSVALEVAGNSLFAPQSITAPESHAIARYTLAGEASQAQFQTHWERAFDTWQDEQNAVVLVELPSASSADALLLSSAVPHVVWLAAANSTETQQTMKRVVSLKNTGCNLIGAVLNRVSAKAAAAALGLCLGLAGLLPSASAQPVSPATNLVAGPRLAPWQERLTLGPGDVFDISLYGQADSARGGISIGPDGRLSYLQARDIEANGLTIDELRTKLETILTKYHLSPRVVISPVAFHSKKYYLLGTVVHPGAFTLDKPTTLVEAIALASGFVAGDRQRESFAQADLTRAFLVRRQPNGDYARESVDFEKLFMRGDLQENRFLAPDDYLYFPSSGLEDVYVLGEVRTTGPVAYTKNLTVLGAIAVRGGFNDPAFREKILVVRGSLKDPEAFAVTATTVERLRSTIATATPDTTIVNSAKALRASVPDFALQPRDIIYVSRKPWAKAEELLQGASSDFVRAVVVTWTGQHIRPLSR